GGLAHSASKELGTRSRNCATRRINLGITSPSHMTKRGDSRDEPAESDFIAATSDDATGRGTDPQAYDGRMTWLPSVSSASGAAASARSISSSAGMEPSPSDVSSNASPWP